MVAAVGILFPAGVAFGGARYVPAHDAVVLLRVPPGVDALIPISARDGENPASRMPVRNPAAGPSQGLSQDLASALVQAGNLASAARRNADPRLLTRAQGLLAPWWDSRSPSVGLCLMRARIRQGLHAFGEALEDIDRTLDLDPRNPEAWLLKTTIHEVRGEDTRARASCLQLARFADELTATTAAAALSGFQGSGLSAADRLASAIQHNPTAPESVRGWAWTTLGEIRAAWGQTADAERSFREALRLEPGLAYTKAALADLLLETGRASEVLALMDGAESDASRLRLAEAECQVDLQGQRTQRLLADLDEAFALAAARGDELHLREHARFLLRVRHQPVPALALARRNWDVQREPADLRLLLECARAAGDETAFAAAADWARAHQPTALRSLGEERRRQGTHEEFSR